MIFSQYTRSYNAVWDRCRTNWKSLGGTMLRAPSVPIIRRGHLVHRFSRADPESRRRRKVLGKPGHIFENLGTHLNTWAHIWKPELTFKNLGSHIWKPRLTFENLGSHLKTWARIWKPGLTFENLGSHLKTWAHIWKASLSCFNTNGLIWPLATCNATLWCPTANFQSDWGCCTWPAWYW